jgi:ferredoxin
MYRKPSPWSQVLRYAPLWQPLTDFWARTTKWPVVGKYFRWILNEDHYDVTFVPINEELEGSQSTVVPKQVVEEIIKRSCHRVVLKACLCRMGCGCNDYPMGLGCIFLGDSTKNIDPTLGKHVSVEEALAHMDKCLDAGLIPQIGRVDADPLMAGVGKMESWDRFLTLCFCCTCCCIAMRNWPRWADEVKERMHRLEGLSIEVTDECNGCGKCMKSCFTDAIIIKDKLAQIGDDCKGCGLCVDACPKHAIKIEVKDGDRMVSAAYQRIESYADIVSET